MKTRMNLLRLFLLLLFGVTVSTLNAQDKKPSVKSAIESKQFVFKAQRVLPLSGRVRQVNSEGYEVRVAGDSLVFYFPYFGRAYSAPINSSEGGLNFTCVKF